MRIASAASRSAVVSVRSSIVIAEHLGIDRIWHCLAGERGDEVGSRGGGHTRARSHGGTANVRHGGDIWQRQQRVVGADWLAFEYIQAGRARAPLPQSRDQLQFFD